MMSAYLQSIALIEMSISCTVVLVWLIQKVSKTEMPVAIRLALLLILGNLFFWPIGLSLELPLSAYVRGVTGDLSIVTLLLLWGSILPASQKTPLGFKVSVAFLAIVFYPLALGFGIFDPYALGYGSLGLLIAVTIFAVICGVAGWVGGVWIFSLAMIAWTVRWHESANLWDYLLDPFLAIYCIVALFYAIYSKRREKAQSGYLFRAG